MPPQAERQEESSDESSPYQSIPSRSTSIADLGQLSDSIEGSAARATEADAADLTAVSLDDLNIPLFEGPVPAPEVIAQQISTINDTLLGMDQAIAELEGRLASTQASSGTRDSASSIDTPVRRPSLVFAQSDSTTAERRETGPEEADLEDDGTFPFSPASTEAQFIPPSTRRASTASIGYDFTDTEFHETAAYTTGVASDTVRQEEPILPSASTSQTGVRSAPAPYAGTFDTPSTTTQADVPRAVVSTLHPPAQHAIQQLSNAGELAGLTPQSPIVQNATREDVAALTVAQISSLSRDVLISLNQCLKIVRDGQSAIWTAEQVAAFMARTHVANRRTERRSQVERRAAQASIQRTQVQPTAPSTTAAPQLSFSTSSANASLQTSRPVAPLSSSSSAIGAEGFTPRVTHHTLSPSTTSLSVGGVHQRLAGLTSGQPGAAPTSASVRNLSAAAEVELRFDLPDTPQDLFIGMVRRYSAQRLAAPTSTTVDRLARIQARQQQRDTGAAISRPVFRENTSSTAGGNAGGVNSEDSDQSSD
ncbi:MAG: hypothetical protein ACRCWB_00820 [Enterovibrio sp.]